MQNNYDVIIVGAGVGGVFSALRIALEHKAKTLLIDLGAGPAKRRRQLEGWLGSFPAGDGKLYPNDLDQILDLVDGRKAKPAAKWVTDIMGQANPMKLIKDSIPSSLIQKKIKSLDFEIKQNNYYQWKPDSIHKLSKLINSDIETNPNIEFSFNNEVYKIMKKRGLFQISTQNGDFYAKKIILAVGRSGWRWATKTYKELGICANDDYAKFGMRIELSCQYMKDFNRSHCSIVRPDLELGPFSWNGTIIPEDHADLVISAFRSNEERWRTEKVSFSLIGKRYYKDQGCYQSDRLAKLAYLLFNDRVSKERVRLFLRNKSQLSLLPEYSWLVSSIKEIEAFIPNIMTKGFFHIPHILPLPAEVRLSPNLESEMDNLFIVGESAGIRGIMGAAISGTIAADSACK